MTKQQRIALVFQHIILSVLAIVFFGTVVVSAISQEQRRLFDSGIMYFDVDTGSGGQSCGGSGGLVTDGIMSTFYPGFDDEAAMAARIEEYIREVAPSSPWLEISDFGNRFIAETKRLNVNPLMIVAIGRKESGIGTARYNSAGNELSAWRAKNSFGDKSSSTVYRDYGTWEASLFGGEGEPGKTSSFTSRVAHRLNGHHPNYAGVTNMYEYISVHLTGQIYQEGDGGSSYDPIMGVSVSLPNVQAYYGDAKKWIGEIMGQEVGDTTGAVSSCNSSGVVNGSIVDTALGLAWTDSAKTAEIKAAKALTDGLCTMTGGNHNTCGQAKINAGGFIGERHAKPEYVTAVKQYNPGNDSDGSNWAFSDCGVFVATVMRASGADPEFAVRGTTLNQLPYLQNSSKYDTVLFTDTSQLMPGDVLIKPGHIRIYIGPNETTTAVVAEASWGQHVPATLWNTVTPGDGYYRARLIAGAE